MCPTATRPAFTSTSATTAPWSASSRDREVLNCFCYIGGFSLAALAGGARRVVLIDSPGDALELAQCNVAANGLDPARASWLDADAFKTLRHLADEGERFDLVVARPAQVRAGPRARQSRRARLQLSGFRLLRLSGLLFTYSCSGAIDMDLFHKIVVGASTRGSLSGSAGASTTHPLLTAFPEGEYLKGLLLQIA
ncbi:MAG: class I SAM-dependent methyltransferase [Burkholderia sp.]